MTPFRERRSYHGCLKSNDKGRWTGNWVGYDDDTAYHHDKVIMLIFLDSQGFFHQHVIPQEQTVTIDYRNFILTIMLRHFRKKTDNFDLL